MKVQGFLLLLVVCVMVSAYPRNKKPIHIDQQASSDTYEDSSLVRAQRQAGGGGDHHEAVDFGAHTGDHGAFGWYADFPVHAHS